MLTVQSCAETLTKVYHSSLRAFSEKVAEKIGDWPPTSFLARIPPLECTIVRIKCNLKVLKLLCLSPALCSLYCITWDTEPLRQDRKEELCHIQQFEE